MKIPSLKKRVLGDLDAQLNAQRRQMNHEIREQCFEILEKKRMEEKANA